MSDNRGTTAATAAAAIIIIIIIIIVTAFATPSPTISGSMQS
jgi:hypothetical protein